MSKDGLGENSDYDFEEATDMLSSGSYEDLSNEKEEKQIFSLVDSYNKFPKSATELSAQMMNVRFEDNKSSLSMHDQQPQNRVTKISPFDILEKIKDIYKTCTCKVCECIIGKIQKNETCNCKPCGCDDCKHFNTETTITNIVRSLDEARSDNLGLKRDCFDKLNSIQNCNCKPCECNKCVKNAFLLSCAHDPYRCFECKPRYNYNKYENFNITSIKRSDSNQQNCGCAPCNCAECSIYQSTHQRRDISTGINKPREYCCETCLHEIRVRRSTNLCCREQRNRAIRKSIQRDTDRHNRRSTQNLRHADKSVGLKVMVAAMSKICPEYNPEAKTCSCGDRKFKKIYCIKKDASNFINTSKRFCGKHKLNYDTLKYIPLHREFINARETCVSASNTMSCIRNLKRPCVSIPANDILSKRRCNKSNESTRYDCDLKSAHILNFKQRFHKDEKKRNKREKPTSVMFNNGSSNRLENEEMSSNFDCENSFRKVSLLGNYYEIKLAKNYLFDEHHRNVCINSPVIDQQPSQKLCSKLNKSTDSSNTLPYDANTSVKSQVPNSGVIDDLPTYTSSKREQNSDRNYQTMNKSSKPSDSCNLIPLLNKTTNTIRFNTFCESKEIKLQSLSKSVTNHYDYFPDCQNCYSEKSCATLATLAKCTKSCDLKRYSNSKLEKRNYIDSVNVSSQCNLSGNRNAGNSLISKISLPKIQQSSTIDRKWHYRCLKINGKVQRHETDPVNLKKPSNIVNNSLDHEDDYKMARKTIKDARRFSLHLKKLLDTYEKANREFESVYNGLRYSDKSLQHEGSTSQTVEINKPTVSDNTMSVIRKNLTDNVPTSINTSFSDDINHRKITKNVEPILSPCDLNIHCNVKDNTSSMPASLQNIVAADLSNGNFAEVIISNEGSNNLNSPNDTVTEINQDPSNNIINLNRTKTSHDLNDLRKSLVSMIEAFVPSNVHVSLKKKNAKNHTKKHTKMYKQAVIMLNQKKFNKPILSDCSNIIKTNLDVEHNEQEKSILHNITTEGEHSIAVTKCEVFENCFSIIDTSSSITNTARNIKNCPGKEQISRRHHQNYIDEQINLPTETKQSNKIAVFVKSTQTEVTGPIKHDELLAAIIEDPVNAVEQSLINAMNRRLHFELIEKLLQLLQRHKWETQLPKVHGNENTKKVLKSESLRVSSLCVRKVSECTILVKWQVPKVLTDVEGYELLVNGRPVQKIEDNLCRESVLSALPRDDRILLTVRTMTKSQTTNRSPTTTIIYASKHNVT